MNLDRVGFGLRLDLRGSGRLISVLLSLDHRWLRACRSGFGRRLVDDLFRRPRVGWVLLYGLAVDRAYLRRHALNFRNLGPLFVDSVPLPRYLILSVLDPLLQSDDLVRDVGLLCHSLGMLALVLQFLGLQETLVKLLQHGIFYLLLLHSHLVPCLDDAAIGILVAHELATDQFLGLEAFDGDLSVVSLRLGKKEQLVSTFDEVFLLRPERTDDLDLLQDALVL